MKALSRFGTVNGEIAKMRKKASGIALIVPLTGQEFWRCWRSWIVIKYLKNQVFSDFESKLNGFSYFGVTNEAGVTALVAIAGIDPPYIAVNKT